jgi:hypothetical protein
VNDKVFMLVECARDALLRRVISCFGEQSPSSNGDAGVRAQRRVGLLGGELAQCQMVVAAC